MGYLRRPNPSPLNARRRTHPSPLQGCGLVTMCLHDDAQAAIEALNSTFVWEGMDGPMVVKWMDTALQQRRREQHLASMRAGVASGMAAGGGGEG